MASDFHHNQLEEDDIEYVMLSSVQLTEQT